MELPSRNYHEVALGQFHRLRHPSNLQPAITLYHYVKYCPIPLDTNPPGGPEFGPKSDGALEANAPQQVGKQVWAQPPGTLPLSVYRRRHDTTPRES